MHLDIALVRITTVARCGMCQLLLAGTGLFCHTPYPRAVEANSQRQLTHRWPGVGRAAWGMASEDSCSAWARVRAESAFLLRLCSGPLGPTCWALQHMTVRRWANALTGGAFSTCRVRGVSPPFFGAGMQRKREGLTQITTACKPLQ